jgi:hypothetical protein
MEEVNIRGRKQKKKKKNTSIASFLNSDALINMHATVYQLHR